MRAFFHAVPYGSNDVFQKKPQLWRGCEKLRKKGETTLTAHEA